jgi:hypothetical protein
MNFIFDNDILNNLDLDFKNLIQDDCKIYYKNTSSNIFITLFGLKIL